MPRESKLVDEALQIENLKPNALAVFTKTPERGETKTRLQPLLGDDGALAAHIELVETTLTRVAQTDAAHSLWVTRFSDEVAGWGEAFAFDIAEQTSGDLGQRMRHVFEQLFAKGHETVCLIGTDCPTIDATYVESAFNTLAEADVVFGPAEDGGYGLIALANRSDTDWGVLFENIPWSTAEVCALSLARAREAGMRVRCLPEIWDVDHPADWQRYLRWRRRV